MTESEKYKVERSSIKSSNDFDRSQSLSRFDPIKIKPVINKKENICNKD